ncbi:MAG: 23S rRNA (pseudouridine(1915)-N(3))-methyltransferase RlmH [Marinilabiliaceae bacterium]|nr:23S rRNA (pseudouridine(1915)-N(3))-methyltransferase RlmH [Marinilabiliaceae bacterium]
MKLTLLTIGKTDDAYINEGITRYTDRIRHYMPFEMVVLPDVKRSKGLTPEMQKRAEAKIISEQLTPTDIVCLLDENGKEYTSRAFADYITKTSNSGARRLIFIIGGPYGFDDEIYSKANHKISLSRMTFSHQMVRLIFAEQLYRAMTIIRGEPYHHD